jgi:hypothetical protein
MSHEINLLDDDEKPGDFYPLWNETRAMPFRRTPYPATTFEIAIGTADELLIDESVLGSEKASTLASRLRAFIALQDHHGQVSQRWYPSSGLWLELHARAKNDEPAWLGRSRVNRREFSDFWEVELAPYLVELQKRASDV